jgi:hypothetical protein
MRKIYFLCLLFISFNQFAQLNNWDSVVVDGFGSNLKIRQLASYNGGMYAGTESPTAAPANIYFSANGDMNTWAATNFASSANFGDTIVDQLVADTSAGGKLFIGVSNWQNGVSVHTYNGASWSSLSGTVPPWDSTYNIIPKLFFYSAGGGADSVFIIIGNYNDLVPYQIWKSAKNTPTWSLVLTMPSYTMINDAIVYNDSIFFTASSSLTMENFIYKCTNGSDTLRAHALSGMGDFNNQFSSLGIHNNNLYVGTQNYGNGANLYTYNSITGWADVTLNGFGYTTNLIAIEKITSFRNKLWIECTVQHGSPFLLGRSVNPNNSVLGMPMTAIVLKSEDGINLLNPRLLDFMISLI